jgi:uroporphyrinogen-III synthase
MRLLVTRPEGEAARTAAVLRGRGHEVLLQPMLTIAYETPPAAMATPRAILITSQNAVRALLHWPQAARWREVAVFTAGPATAEAARASGFLNVAAGVGGAAALAETVATAVPAGEGTLLYPAAHDRTGDLDGRLADLGYRVVTIVAYRAEAARSLAPAVRSALAAEELDGVLIYSRRTAETFRGLVEDAGLEAAFTRLHWYALSEDVAAALPTDVEVNVAARPEESSLLALIPTARSTG